MMQSKKSFRLAALVLPLLASGTVDAHQIWIEQDARSAKLYFGEFGQNLREVSPGRLDKFVKPAATLVSAKGERVVPFAKTADAFALQARAAKGESLVAEEASYPVREKKEGDKIIRTAWTPGARYIADFTAQAPRLTLDVVPTGKRGEFQVIYRGQPLPKAEVGILAVSGWRLGGTTDEKGNVSFALPWKGPYLVEVRHTDNTPGKRHGASGEEKYDVASFVTTLSFATPSGLVSPPAPPRK